MSNVIEKVELLEKHIEQLVTAAEKQCVLIEELTKLCCTLDIRIKVLEARN